MPVRTSQYPPHMRSKHAPGGSTHTPRIGVRLMTPRVGRPKPFGVEWSEFPPDPITGQPIRKPRRRFFPTIELAEAFAADRKREKRRGEGRTLSRAEVDDYLALRSAIGDTPWTVVVAAWHREQQAHGLAADSRTVASAVADYLAAEFRRTERRELAVGTYTQRRHKLRLFAQDFGPRPLAALTSAEIRAWLDRPHLAAAHTYNNWLKILRGFFNEAVDHHQLARNPCDALRPRSAVADEVGILTVPQLAALFHCAATHRTAPEGPPLFAVALRRLALEAFAGVRFSSACRLAPEDIVTEDRGIRHPAATIKTKRRHYVSGYPEVLWAWLAIAPDDRALTARQYLALKSALFTAARVPHPHNCLRHSFATYHLAALSDPGKTAVLLCHRSQEKLWGNYKGNVPSSAGQRWLGLLPGAVAEIAAEWVPPVVSAPA